MFNQIQYRITQKQLLLIYYVNFFRILYFLFDFYMMEMEMSHKDFYSMFEDVEKMKYEFDYKILNCCLTRQRLLIIGPDKIICEKTGGFCDNAYYAVDENKDVKQGYPNYYFPYQKKVYIEIECVWCEMMQPYLLQKEGNYHCVKPRRLLQAVNKVNDLMTKKNIFDKSIVIGMAERFYIKVKGTSEKYENISPLFLDYEPDIILYQESGAVNVEWKIIVECS